jgi:3-oxoacyl-[acyl-carrier protein] reductase
MGTMNMEFGLSDKTVLVTGASGTIGRTIAEAFGAEGARVIVGYHSRSLGADAAVVAVDKAGGRATALRLDLSRPESLAADVEAVTGQIDVLVNNAVEWPIGGVFGEKFEDVAIDRVRKSVEANVVGAYALSQIAVRSMRSTGWGRVVHISTGLVLDGFAGSAPYTTPKAALGGLTKTMSRELAGVGVLTNLVMAGYVPHGEVPEDVLEQVTRAAATRRTTAAQEVANVVVFLCSMANGNVTGETIRADGHFLTRD